jgi:hypothetical protein
MMIQEMKNQWLNLKILPPHPPSLKRVSIKRRKRRRKRKERKIVQKSLSRLDWNWGGKLLGFLWRIDGEHPMLLVRKGGLLLVYRLRREWDLGLGQEKVLEMSKGKEMEEMERKKGSWIRLMLMLDMRIT